MKIKIRALQVMCGDSIWVELGEGKQRYDILIDAGYANTFLTSLNPVFSALKKKKIDLWILTHLDADHINGAVSFLRSRNESLKGRVAQFWFNCFDRFQMPANTRKVSVGKGIEIRDRLKTVGSTLDNQLVAGMDKVVGGVQFRIISPDQDTFNKLESKWKVLEKEYWKKKGAKKVLASERKDDLLTIEELAARPDACEDENDIANMSSIAFSLETKENKVLFLGDAHPTKLIAGLKRLQPEDGSRIYYDCIKLPHHGSRANYSSKLLDVVESYRFIISCNPGNSHGLPNKEVLSKILMHPKRNKEKQIEFIFNYKGGVFDKIFKVDENHLIKHNFTCNYPEGNRKYGEIKFGTKND